MITDDIMLIKYMEAGLPIDRIAGRLGITEEEVTKRWNAILDKGNQMLSSGYGALNDQYTLLCQQYQLMGQSLKIIASALANAMPERELRELVTDNKDETVRNLLSRCIVLRPFVAVDPIAMLEEDLKRQQTGN